MDIPLPAAVHTFEAQQLSQEGAGAAVHIERVRLHISELLELLSAGRRYRKRDVIDRLIWTRFISVGEECLCLEPARGARAAARFDGWVHRHHASLNVLMSAILTTQRSTLLDVAERYQLSVESEDTPGAPSIVELRLLQDWLFQPFEARFQANFRARLAELKPRT